ncbi:phospholipase D/nuclease [Lichtheimia hyalospora FSU 10163]|nr:phospholipase D/nuclease [Lichtheimia hyalospora FSU 10163]
MNVLYELFCMGTPPSLTGQDLKKANFQPFMNKTLQSAKLIMNDDTLKQDATSRIKSLLGSKSHSVNNTMRTVNTMFDAARQACEFDRERCMIEWLETCVTMAIQMGLQEASGATTAAVPSTYDKIGASEDEEEDAVVPQPSSKPRRKQPPRRQPKNRDSDEEYRPSFDDDDDDFTPVTYHDDKKTNEPPVFKKKGDELVSAIKPGAGAGAVLKHFNANSVALQNGYFARSYFFPSKESFNAFISTLHSAQSTIDICVYSMTDDDTADALILAKKRNVKIRIITDDQQAASKYADPSRLQKDHGIPYKTDNSPSYMHNKFAVIDGKTLINGSFNWSRNARFKNRENIVITNIPECIKEFEVEFERLWNTFEFEP